MHTFLADVTFADIITDSMRCKQHSHGVEQPVHPRHSACIQPVHCLNSHSFVIHKHGDSVTEKTLGLGKILAVVLADLSKTCLLCADACRLHAPGTSNNAPVAQYHKCN